MGDTLEGGDAASPTASEINVKVLGDSSCGTKALTEAYRAIGLNANGQPIDGKSVHYEAVVQLLPQLLDRSGGWDTRLDQPNDRQPKDSNVSNLEVMAALVAAAQLSVSRNIKIEEVSLQEIVDGMCEPLKALRGQARTVCRPGDGPPAARGQ